MNLIEKEAKQFFRDLYRGTKVNNLENLKEKITSKLYNFNRDRDKLDFLKTIRQMTTEDIEEYKKKSSDKWYVEERQIGIFAIDQEIDDINEFYTFEPKPENQFSVEEESELHDKLNDIVEKLEKQGYGQQIIFEEIEDLKNHFNLGKKTWFQLLKGKVVDLTFKKVLNETIVKDIYNQLSEGFDEVIKMIE